MLWCSTSSATLGWGEGKKDLNLGFICRPRTTLRQRFGALSCQRFWRREICILLCKYFQRKILNDKWNWHQMHYESRDNVQWKSRRLLVAVVSLSFCLVETNCSQARRSSFGCVERGKYYAAILKELGCFIWYVNFEQALRNPQILEFKFPVSFVWFLGCRPPGKNSSKNKKANLSKQRLFSFIAYVFWLA